MYQSLREKGSTVLFLIPFLPFDNRLFLPTAMAANGRRNVVGCVVMRLSRGLRALQNSLSGVVGSPCARPHSAPEVVRAPDAGRPLFLTARRSGQTLLGQAVPDSLASRLFRQQMVNVSNCFC